VPSLDGQEIEPYANALFRAWKLGEAKKNNGALLLIAPKERRVCLPNTRFMIHQPSGGAGGQSTDIAIQAKEILRTRERIARVIAAETGTALERVRQDMERDYWMSAGEAIEYGIVSRIVERHTDLSH